MSDTDVLLPMMNTTIESQYLWKYDMTGVEKGQLFAAWKTVLPRSVPPEKQTDILDLLILLTCKVSSCFTIPAMWIGTQMFTVLLEAFHCQIYLDLSVLTFLLLYYHNKLLKNVNAFLWPNVCLPFYYSGKVCVICPSSRKVCTKMRTVKRHRIIPFPM